MGALNRNNTSTRCERKSSGITVTLTNPHIISAGDNIDTFSFQDLSGGS